MTVELQSNDNPILGRGYNYDWTAIRPRYDHSTTYVTIGLLHCSLIKRLQVTCPKGHLSEMELSRFRNSTLNLTLTLALKLTYTFRTNDPSDK